MNDTQQHPTRHINANQSQIGVIGDHAHVDGGIHFHYHETTSTLPLREGRHDFYRHIPMPDHYIPRPEVLDALREALLSGDGAVALTSAVKVALHGMGGIGKSVLARALCDDPAVQAAFPDGILWTTLGRDVNEPVLRSKLREWVETLGGIISENAPTLDQLKNKLVQLLEARACLLIVDDAWQHTHAAAFQAGGPRCRLLLTTRDAEVARTVGAKVHPVETLPPEQAVALLQEWAQGKLAAASPDVLSQIVKRLGCLPLALKLAGAQLRDRDPARWLETFDARKLKARRPETLHDNLEQTLALSLDSLSSADRRCYTALAIFKEDEPIPLCAITKLWGALEGLNADESAILLNDLAARALLHPSSRHSEERSGEEFHTALHDLLRDFIKTELGDQGTQEIHRVLLNAYRQTIPNVPLRAAKERTPWHTAPNDGYLYSHLAYHLDAVDDETDLRALFADDAWLHARVPADNYTYDGYLADLALVWKRAQDLAMRQIAEGRPPLAVADCIHYVLIHTTVNSLASNYGPELVARAVETGLWSPERGTNLAYRVIGSSQKAELIGMLLRTGQLSEKQRETLLHLGLSVARSTTNIEAQSQVLASMAKHLEGDERKLVLTEGLILASATADEGVTEIINFGSLFGLSFTTSQYRLARRMILRNLIPMIKEDNLLKDALQITQTISDEIARALVLIELAPKLEGNLAARAFALLQAIVDEEAKAYTLMALSPQLDGSLLQNAVALAYTIVDGRYRTMVLAKLAIQMQPDEQMQVLPEILLMVRILKDERFKVGILSMLVPHLEDELLAEALTITRKLQSKREQAEVLAALTPQQLKDNLLIEELMATDAIGDEEHRSFIISALAAHLTEERLAEELSMVHAIKDEENRSQILLALAPHLTGKLLAQGLVAACGIENEEKRSEVLETLVPHLTGELLAQGLTAACGIDNEVWRAYVLAALAPHLEGELLMEGVAATQVLENKQCQRKVWIKLIPRLEKEISIQILMDIMTDSNKKIRTPWGVELTRNTPDWGELISQLNREQLAIPLSGIQTISDKDHQVQALTALALNLEEAVQEQVLEVALALALEISDEGTRAGVLVKLASQLPESSFARILKAAQGIKHEVYRAWCLAMMIPQLGEKERTCILSESLKTAQKTLNETLIIDSGSGRNSGSQSGAGGYILESLTPQLKGELLLDGLAIAQEINDERLRGRVLIALVPQLANMPQAHKLLAEVMATASAIRAEDTQAGILRALAAHLTGELLTEGFVLAQGIKESWMQESVLAAFVPKLEGGLLIDGLTTARAIEDEGRRSRTLAAFALQLEGELRQQVLTECLTAARAIETKRGQVDALVTLIPQLTGELQQQVLTECLTAARAIEDEEERERALTALSPQLEGNVRHQVVVERVTAERAIANKKGRVALLAASAFIPEVPDHLLRDIRQDLLRCMWSSQNRERSKLLGMLAHDKAVFLRAFDLPPEAYIPITHSIINICTKWDWI